MAKQHQLLNKSVSIATEATCSTPPKHAVSLILREYTFASGAVVVSVQLGQCHVGHVRHSFWQLAAL